MIRLIVCVVSVGLFFLVSLVLLPIEWLFGKISPKTRDIHALRIVQWMFRVVLFFSGTKITVIGKERVPKDQAVLYIGNHRSIFDVVITYSMVPGLTGYVAKTELLRIPILSSWMKLLHCLFLDRKDIRQGMKTILSAIELVRNGVSIFIYPEGTRGKSENVSEMLEFHEGSFRISTKTGCLIVPVAINHSSAILEDHFPRLKPTHVIVEYCEPIDPGKLTKEEQKRLGVKTRLMIQEKLLANEAG
ncbi:MAG: 1-acyl-sn-glycerol-3-phosphate acyltransferase [Blautia sp.]|nr:1-acyl-sn-glycerol-3-phosphate acyltransferase [Blautia sp.]